MCMYTCICMRMYMYEDLHEGRGAACIRTRVHDMCMHACMYMCICMCMQQLGDLLLRADRAAREHADEAVGDRELVVGVGEGERL